MSYPLKRGFAAKIGVARSQKSHKFDLGADSPPVIVECKSHRWTSGNNVPSAKMTTWNEAMYLFHCAPRACRKIMFVLRDERATSGETLAAYYLRIYPHLIPPEVEVWEYDERSKKYEVLHSSLTRGAV